MVLAVTRLSVRVQSNIGIIRAGVARGLGSNAIQDLIRLTGQPGIRRQDLLQGIRHARGIAETGTRLRSIGLDRFPDPARLTQARGPMLSNFSYEVRIGPEFLEDGTKNRKFITVRSDNNLTPRQILEEAETALRESPDDSFYKRILGDEPLQIVGGRRR